MGMCLALHSVSDENINRILEQPALIWRLLDPDSPEAYTDAVAVKPQNGLIAKIFGKKEATPVADDIPNLNFVEGENAEDDLDKSWQGIHYCLNKTAWEAEPPMDFIVVGGTPAGDIDVGYGPARLFKSDVVQEIDSKLAKISVEDISANYNPEEMERLDIYPSIWSEEGDEALEYITSYFVNLKSFISNCVKNNLGMTIYIC